MNYSIAACIAFCLRPFMNAVRTNYRTAGDVTLSSSGTRSQGYTDLSKQTSSANESFPMLPIRKKKKKVGNNDNNDNGSPQATSSVSDEERVRTGGLFRPKGTGLTVSTAIVDDIRPAEGNDEGSMGSGRSSRMIIRKDVHYTVKHSPRMSDASRL